MKKILAMTVAACLVGTMATFPAYAGDRGWDTAGQILTGFIGLSILAHTLSHSYPYPEPVYAPSPRDYYPPGQVWVPGHYESRMERQWVPGHWEAERNGRHRQGDYDDDDYGHGARRYWVPGHYRNIEVSVWVPGHWEG